ncbi:hypothetical protein OEIGOIKO_01725 [Streptomyces chrestomyceticus JCM 4735]|uniref:Glycosyltransferase n=1 Tax=Streptomyces chrestomyceticus JCM 4735 TaxID=1306181 RepID=A0A7U9KRM2_9ACTN|nr:hypothetical protein OEIGOIKO_01725 [Streptomyces chrestomyceticus JCM 4735]
MPWRRARAGPYRPAPGARRRWGTQECRGGPVWLRPVPVRVIRSVRPSGPASWCSGRSGSGPADGGTRAAGPAHRPSAARAGAGGALTSRRGRRGHGRGRPAAARVGARPRRAADDPLDRSAARRRRRPARQRARQPPAAPGTAPGPAARLRASGHPADRGSGLARGRARAQPLVPSADLVRHSGGPRGSADRGASGALPRAGRGRGAPGADAAARRWPPERFAAVAHALHRAGHRVVVTAGAGEGPLARQVAAQAGLPPSAVLGARRTCRSGSWRRWSPGPVR